jgi:hypothetical protein
MRTPQVARAGGQFNLRGFLRAIRLYLQHEKDAQNLLRAAEGFWDGQEAALAARRRTACTAASGVPGSSRRGRVQCIVHRLASDWLCFHSIPARDHPPVTGQACPRTSPAGWLLAVQMGSSRPSSEHALWQTSRPGAVLKAPDAHGAFVAVGSTSFKDPTVAGTPVPARLQCVPKARASGVRGVVARNQVCRGARSAKRVPLTGQAARYKGPRYDLVLFHAPSPAWRPRSGRSRRLRASSSKDSQRLTKKIRWEPSFNVPELLGCANGTCGAVVVSRGAPLPDTRRGARAPPHAALRALGPRRPRAACLSEHSASQTAVLLCSTPSHVQALSGTTRKRLSGRAIQGLKHGKELAQVRHRSSCRPRSIRKSSTNIGTSTSTSSRATHSMQHAPACSSPGTTLMLPPRLCSNNGRRHATRSCPPAPLPSRHLPARHSRPSCAQWPPPRSSGR